MGIGLLVMWAIVLKKMHGLSCHLLQVLIDGLFVALLFYFAFYTCDSGGFTEARVVSL